MLLDLFVFLTGATDIHFFGGGLHSGTIDSKREGYKEFTGTLLGTTEKGDQLTFCSLPENEAPLLIQIMTSQERYILSESDQKALSSTKDGQWKWEVEEFNILYQSQLTHLQEELHKEYNTIDINIDTGEINYPPENLNTAENGEVNKED